MQRAAVPRRSEPQTKRAFSRGSLWRLAIGVVVVAFVAWRLWVVLAVQQAYGPDTWVRFAISGLILGGVYAVIALGYTLIYGIMFMINFAHGDVMMLGAFAGYFTLEALSGAGLPSSAWPSVCWSRWCLSALHTVRCATLHGWCR